MRPGASRTHPIRLTIVFIGAREKLSFERAMPAGLVWGPPAKCPTRDIGDDLYRTHG